jgi:hypothetical protein
VVAIIMALARAMAARDGGTEIPADYVVPVA